MRAARRQNAEIVLRRKVQQTLQQTFFAWAYMQRRAKRNREVVINLQAKRVMAVYRVFFSELFRNHVQSLKAWVTKMQNQASLLEANYKQNENYVQAVDDEKQEIIEKYKYTQTEVEEQRDIISQKDQEIVIIFIFSKEKGFPLLLLYYMLIS